jgi:hypothetical protein
MRAVHYILLGSFLLLLFLFGADYYFSSKDASEYVANPHGDPDPWMEQEEALKGLILSPPSKFLQIPAGKTGSLSLDINNRANSSGSFSYDISFPDPGNCDESINPLDWLNAEGEGDNLVVAPGYSQRSHQEVVLQIPEDIRSCTFRLHISVFRGQELYAKDSIDIQVL